MRKYISEALGTFFLVLLGCGTAALIGCEVTGGYLATALAFGLAIVVIAYSVGSISGGHVNPAVSTAMLINGKLSVKDFVCYIVSQVIGAFAASGVLVYILGVDSGLGANGLYDGSMVKSIIIEIILTFIFVMAILGVTDDKKGTPGFGGLVIGLTLTVVHILGIGLTGTSVNPARSLAPAILVGGDALSALPAFIIGPVVGAVIAAFCWKFISKEE